MLVLVVVPVCLVLLVHCKHCQQLLLLLLEGHVIEASSSHLLHGMFFKWMALWPLLFLLLLLLLLPQYSHLVQHF